MAYDISRRKFVQASAFGAAGSLSLVGAASAAFAGEAAAGTGASESGLPGFVDWVAQDGVFRTAMSFIDDESAKPSDDDLIKIMRTGTLASCGGGAQPWYFVAVTGYEDQQGIAPGYTNHGTATILCCTTNDALANIATVPSDGTTSQTLCNIFDLGDATGYMCLAAMSLGYQVHIEASVNRMDHDDATGQLSTAEICEKYVRGTYYYGGMAAMFSETPYEDAAEFCPHIVAALHLGKVEQVDGVSGATAIERVQNYAIWSEDLQFEGVIDYYGTASVEVVENPTNLFAPDWSLDGLVVKVTYDDGTSENVAYDAAEDTGDSAKWSSTYGSAADALGHANQSAQYDLIVKYANRKITITLNPGVTA